MTHVLEKLDENTIVKRLIRGFVFRLINYRLFYLQVACFPHPPFWWFNEIGDFTKITTWYLLYLTVRQISRERLCAWNNPIYIWGTVLFDRTWQSRCSRWLTKFLFDNVIASFIFFKQTIFIFQQSFFCQNTLEFTAEKKVKVKII